MPEFEVEWEMHGTAKVDADDFEEAAQIAEECLGNLDHSMLNEIDVAEVSVTEADEDDDD